MPWGPTPRASRNSIPPWWPVPPCSWTKLEQAITIGECQHAFRTGLISHESFRGSIGAVVAGLCEGRRNADEITLFDGTGVALQDLVVADLAVRQAARRQLGCRVDY